jgi:DNA repair exonuclease SbcCD ATPase subunit
MLQIKRLKIDGFRGFPVKSDTFEFKTPINLFYGENHQGKSSVLNAIEWCLYGDQCTGVKSGIRERKDWEIVNRNSSNAIVEIEMETDGEIIKIKRTESKGNGRIERTIEVVLPNGSVKNGDDAESEITRLVRLSYIDYATTIYQHQETIRAIVTQEPSKRNKAMDLLLGLADYINILDGIKISKVKDVQKELIDNFDDFQDKVEERIRIRQGELEKNKNKAKSKGIKNEELNKTGLKKYMKDVKKDAINFASKLGISIKKISIPSEWEGAYIFSEMIEEEIDRLWSKSPDISEHSELNSRRLEADDIKRKYIRQKKLLQKIKIRLRKFEKDYGSQKEIEDELENISEDIDDIKQEIKRISPKANLIKEGIEILKDASLGYEENVCPLCGKKVPNILDHLEKEWKQKIKIKINKLDSRKEELEKRQGELEDLQIEYKKIIEDIEREEKGLLKVIKDISKFLGKKFTDQEDPLAFLKKEIEEIKDNLNDIEKSIEDKLGKIKDIKEKNNKVVLIHNILELDNKIEEIVKINETDEYKEAEKFRDNLSKFINDIEEISNKVRECSVDEAKNKISSAETAINDYFIKITRNPGIKQIKLIVEKDSRTGRNSYSFLDHSENEVTPILSLGDFNSLALSIFLGLSKIDSESHPLGFIIMDDPSQSLSKQQKKRFVEVLGEVSQSKNLLISTMDTELQNFLEKLTLKKTIYEFSKWTPDSGPSINRRT